MGQESSKSGKRKSFVESQELIQAVIQNFEERWNINAGEVSNLGFEVAAAGSSVLQIALREKWDDSDLDLYIQFIPENLKTLRNYILSKGYVQTQEYPAKIPFDDPTSKNYAYNYTQNYAALNDVFIPKLWEDDNIAHYVRGGFMYRNRLQQIISFKNMATNASIQIIACQDDLSTTIDRFDLNVCSVAFMFLNKSVYLSNDIDPEEIMKKYIMMRAEYKSIYADGNYVLHRRVKKYEARGFTLLNRPPLTRFIRSVNKAINRLNDRLEKWESILENLVYTDFQDNFRPRGWNYDDYETRNLEGEPIRIEIHIHERNRIIYDTMRAIQNLLDELDDAENDDEKQRIIRQLLTKNSQIRYAISDLQLKISNLLNKRQELLRGEIDLFKNKIENVSQKALLTQRHIDGLKTKLKERNSRYYMDLKRTVENVQTEEKYRVQAQLFLEQFVLVNGEFVDQFNINCTNSDDVDLFTREPINELKPENVFKNVIFNDQGQIQRVQCYDLDYLITWIESKENPKRNQWGRFPQREEGTFPDTVRTLGIIERIRYQHAKSKRQITNGINLLTERFNGFKLVLDSEKPEFPYEKALIGGKKRRKIKAKLARRRKVRKSPQRKSRTRK